MRRQLKTLLFYIYLKKSKVKKSSKLKCRFIGYILHYWQEITSQKRIQTIKKNGKVHTCMNRKIITPITPAFYKQFSESLLTRYKYVPEYTKNFGH